MLPLYIHRGSVIHRLPAGGKLLAAMTAGAVIVAAQGILPPLLLIAVIIGLYLAARLPLAAILSALRPVLIFCGLLFALQLALSGPSAATATALRIFALVLATSLVTLTTRMSDMLDALTAAIRRVAPGSASAPRIALAIGLTIRFIPMLLHDIQEVHNARRSRGARGFGILGTGPLIIKILRMTDALGNAIAARGFENRK